MRDEEIFLLHINNNYERLRGRYMKFCHEKLYQFDEDIFSDTIVKCYDTIKRKGRLDDNTPDGIENYFFKSFKINLQREKQYSRNAKRDLNLTDSLESIYEDYYNDSNITPTEKIRNDSWKDFATLYIMMAVEQEFDYEHFHLFQLKMLCNLTYRELAQKTNSKGVRNKVLAVKQWVKDNISKEQIKRAFDEQYGKML